MQEAWWRTPKGTQGLSQPWRDTGQLCVLCVQGKPLGRDLPGLASQAEVREDGSGESPWA